MGMNTNEKRRALKARVLHAASIVIDEATEWEAPYSYAEELSFPEEDLDAEVERVCSEISAELYRRAVRLGWDG